MKPAKVITLSNLHLPHGESSAATLTCQWSVVTAYSAFKKVVHQKVLAVATDATELRLVVQHYEHVALVLVSSRVSVLSSPIPYISVDHDRLLGITDAMIQTKVVANITPTAQTAYVDIHFTQLTYACPQIVGTLNTFGTSYFKKIGNRSTALLRIDGDGSSSVGNVSVGLYPNNVTLTQMEVVVAAGSGVLVPHNITQSIDAINGLVYSYNSVYFHYLFT